MIAIVLLLAQDLREGFEKARSQTEIYPAWETVVDDQHSTWSEIKIVRDSDASHGGSQYLRFTTQGGATAFQQRLKFSIAVSPDRSYALTGYVRITPKLADEKPRANQAFLEIRWLAAGGALLRTDRSVGVRAATDWTAASVDSILTPPEAAWAQIRLSYEGPDVRGECHFDDLTFVSQPRIRIEPVGRELPVFRPKETAAFRITIPESIAGPLTMSLTLRSAQGEVTERTVRFDTKRSVIESFELPSAGYYELLASLVSGGAVVASKTTPVLAPEAPQFPRRNATWLGVVFNPYRDVYRDVAGLTNLLGCQKAKIVLWDHFAGRRSSQPDPAEILALMRASMESEGATFVGILARPPASAYPSVDAATLRENPLTLFARPRKTWEVQLQQTVERYAEIVREWQIGADGDPLPAGADAVLGEAATVMRAALRSANVGVPVPASEAETAVYANAKFYSIQPRGWTSPDSYARRLDVRGRDSHLIIDVPPLGAPEREGARTDQVAAFLKRLVYAATAGNDGPAYVPLSGDAQTGMIDSDGYPNANALAMRIANDILSSARHTPGAHLFPPPVQDFVFEKDGSMILVLWCETGRLMVDAFLGYDARLIEPLGPSRQIVPGFKFELGSMPAFIVGIDPLLLKTQLSLQFYRKDPEVKPDSTLQIRSDPPLKLLRLTNHFDEDIRNVRIEILDPIPAGWTIAPRTDRIPLVMKGQKYEREITITLPQSEQEGLRPLQIELSFDKRTGGEDKHYNIRLKRVLTLVSELAVVTRVERPDAREPNLRAVTIFVANNTDHTVSLVGRIQIPGRPERSVSHGGIKKGTDGEIATFDVQLIQGQPMTLEVSLEEKGGRRLFVNKTIVVR